MSEYALATLSPVRKAAAAADCEFTVETSATRTLAACTPNADVQRMRFQWRESGRVTNTEGQRFVIAPFERTTLWHVNTAQCSMLARPRLLPAAAADAPVDVITLAVLGEK